jgi:hypothetical protein
MAGYDGEDARGWGAGLVADRRLPWQPVDAEHPDGLAWTVDNQVRVHVDGAAYFTRLYQLLSGP